VKDAFIDRHRQQHRITTLCRVLDVSTTGYYAWRRRAMSGRAAANARLLIEIRAIHRESRGTYGSPRMHAELEARGIPCSENRVARLMQRHAVRAKTRRRRFRCTTDSRHAFAVEPNRLARRFAVAQIASTDVAWAGDISLVWTAEGWLYLAVLLDLRSRRVIGWAMQATIDRSLTLQALRMALAQRHPGQHTLHHSDRGSQYACGDYRRLLKQYSIRCSMSRKGDCWDNAVVESFFASLKSELVDDVHWESRSQAGAAIAAYIEGWGNRRRRHSTLGYLSPVQFELRDQLAA
jgi:transposase InsO family protein